MIKTIVSYIFHLPRSPFLEGRWNFEWIGYGSPGLFAARLLSEYAFLVSYLFEFNNIDIYYPISFAGDFLQH